MKYACARLKSAHVPCGKATLQSLPLNRISAGKAYPEEHLQGQACTLQAISGCVAEQSWSACKCSYLFIYTETHSCSLRSPEARASSESVRAGLGRKHGTGGPDLVERQLL